MMRRSVRLAKAIGDASATASVRDTSIARSAKRQFTKADKTEKTARKKKIKVEPDALAENAQNNRLTKNATAAVGVGKRPDKAKTSTGGKIAKVENAEKIKSPRNVANDIKLEDDKRSKFFKKKALTKAKKVERRPPDGWKEILDLVTDMRSERNAPVDSMGGHVLPNRDGEFEFETLIALMLSSQTKDQVVAETMRNLQTHGLTLENIANTPDEELNALIKKVGFHNNKTKYIKASVEIIRTKHNGNVPDTLEGLTSLPGVGPKMALLVLSGAFDKHDLGIAIDTHVHRIANKLGWVNAKTPEATRKQLESWLPKEEWGRINVLLVGLGQMMQQPTYRENMFNHCSKFESERKRQAINLLKRLGMKNIAIE